MYHFSNTYAGGVYGGNNGSNYDSSYNNYNANTNPTGYYDYNPNGGDCANFVSQALHAGGMAMVSGQWYYSNSSPLASPTTSSWYNANDLHTYWNNNFYEVDSGPGTTPSTLYAAPGDVMYEQTTYGHVEVVDLVNNSYVYIDCHDSDAYRYPATYYNGSLWWFEFDPHRSPSGAY